MTVVWWVVAVLVAAFTVVRVSGIERGTPLVQLMAFTPYVAGGALVAAVAAAFTSIPAALVTGAAGLALTAVVIPRVVPKRAAGPGGQRLRVMTANVLWERGDMAALLQLAKTDDVDVLALQEANTSDLEAFDRAGADGLLPFRALHPAPRGRGTAVFSRHPLDGEPMVRVCPSGIQQVRATVLVPGAGPLVVESAHPCAPHPGGKTSCWARDLADQPGAGDGPLRVLLGDFNATLDHAPLRRLLRRGGYRDAAAERGRGLVPTWPYALVPGLLRLFAVTLDHVLVDRRIGVREVAVRPVPGSDHRAVVAELALPQR
ncbi:endonuclease/exonuclease/phosphatase family protein [Dactylosporangium sp. NPDC005572]|uniref:endonuclease/exonuclease/phosphatase family protein n=1 Tax=Dactylosporangium sp. NPDC005572 TaxID=3156889 RepID=UPI0033B58A5E